MVEEILKLIKITKKKLPKMTEDERYFLEIFIEQLIEVLENAD